MDIVLTISSDKSSLLYFFQAFLGLDCAGKPMARLDKRVLDRLSATC